MRIKNIPKPRVVGQMLKPDDLVTVSFLPGGSVAVILGNFPEDTTEVPKETWMQVVDQKTAKVSGEVPELGPPVPCEVRRADQVFRDIFQ